MRSSSLVAFAAALAVVGCASSGTETSAHRRQKSVEVGIASWYGPGFDGKPTASGEIYDMNGVSAAHRTLPLGTLVEVRNLDNGRTLVARINDRGPWVRGRILDLSLGAAQLLGLDQSGIARVRLTVVGDLGSPPTYWVQVGSFRDQERAAALRAELDRRYPGTAIQVGTERYRVQVPSTGKRKAAEALRRDLRRAGYDTLVVRQPRSKR
jgi:rare lipoprotein A